MWISSRHGVYLMKNGSPPMVRLFECMQFSKGTFCRKQGLLREFTKNSKCTRLMQTGRNIQRRLFSKLIKVLAKQATSQVKCINRALRTRAVNEVNVAGQIHFQQVRTLYGWSSCSIIYAEQRNCTLNNSWFFFAYWDYCVQNQPSAVSVRTTVNSVRVYRNYKV